MSIELIGVSKRYGSGAPAVSDVSFRVGDGQLVALLGPSGSGKSTILRMIAGLLEPDSGRIMMHDRDVTRVPVQKRNVGFMFQNYALFKHMTVRANVAFGLEIRRWKREEAVARVDELLSVMRLTDKASRYPAQLSGGERQRVALARALASRPEILLLDEPFGAIDAQVRLELRDWLRRLHDEFHVTTLFVTHDQEEAMEISDRVVVLAQGRMQQIGRPRELFEQPATAFVTGFVGPINSLQGTATDGRVRLGTLAIPAPEVSGRGVPVTVLIRPTDVRVSPSLNGHPDASIVRIAHLGATVKLELILESGDRMTAHVGRDEFAAMRALATEWGRAWPSESGDADEVPDVTAGVQVEIREARVFVSDFSI